MRLKKSKKNKQEGPEIPDKTLETKKSSQSIKRKYQEEEILNVAEDDQRDLRDTSIKSKKKKRHKSIEPIIIEDIEDGNIKNLVEKHENQIVDTNINSEVLHENGGTLSVSKEITMPQNDLLELIRRMDILIPTNDSLSYKSRLEKLNWNDIVFNAYSIENCKETWSLIQKRIRCYRLLKEVLHDANEFILNPPKTKKYLYPGMPPKPPSAYQLFYKKKKPSLVARIPGMELGEVSRQISQMFKNLSVEKRSKYEKLATHLKIKYNEDLDQFYANHPEIARPEKNLKKGSKKEEGKKAIDVRPKKPGTPFFLYFENQLKICSNLIADNQAKISFKEDCKKHWKQLPIKKKVFWITKAEQDISRYDEEVKEYVAKHPDFIPVSVKHILSKEELALMDKVSGKPTKPPNSAYSLFSRNMLQSDEIKKINAKDRMNFIANEWKKCSEEKKTKYKVKANELVEKYKIDFENYLNTLPEDKKQFELQKKAPKKKPKSGNLEDTSKKTNSDKKKPKKITEPSTPPISAFKYFVNTNNFDNKTAKKAWRKLSQMEKDSYEEKLVDIKRKYILDFEKFLNSLSKEELEEYSKMKQDLKITSDDFVDDDSTSSSSSEDESEDTGK